MKEADLCYKELITDLTTIQGDIDHLREKTGIVINDINIIERKIEDIEVKVALLEDRLSNVLKIAYGVVGLVLAAVATAIMSSVIIK